MKRKDLLNLIERASRVEGDTITSAARHISSAIHWTGFSDEENARILEGLKMLSEDSKVHYGLLQDLKGWVERQRKETF